MRPSLSTGAFGRVFGSTAAAYKFFWLLALLKLVPHGERFAVREVLTEMVAAAWAPAALYRLSFGSHDRLQDLVRDLRGEMRLPPNASDSRIRQALASWPKANQRLDPLGRYVPSRFLVPWHGSGLPGALQDDRRNRALIERSQVRRGTALAGPYAVVGSGSALEIEFEPPWRAWLLENIVVLRNFAELELARFLQARNPHVPGIVDKVRPPGLRNLAVARRRFEWCRAAPEGLRDLYTDEPLGGSFVVDHFLPRAFVAHDLLWNLAPASGTTNRLKADQLPDALYLPRLARFHRQILHVGPDSHQDLEDYVAALGADVTTLRAASSEAFTHRLTTLLAPLMQIAENQGFRAAWQPPEFFQAP